MYEAFFQFKSPPFPALPDVTNYFPAQSVESARQCLVRVIERAEGPGLVIGPAGVGKTLLLRVLADHFSRDYRVVMLSGTRFTSRKSLLQSILFELELPYRGLDEGELRLAVIDALRRSDAVPNGILLLLDEAQVLPLRLLDEVRLITNVMHNGQSRVRLVIAGSPRLEEHFTSPKLESFNQRIAARCYLQAFSREETQEYVRAEVSWAGGNPDALFPEAAVRAVFQATDGIPRLINQICDRALILTHALGQTQVDATRIREAWADVQQLPPPWESLHSESRPADSVVIEFGELNDEPRQPASPMVRDGEREAKALVGVGGPWVAQNDTPCGNPGVEWEELGSATVTVQAPYASETVEWIGCADSSADRIPTVDRIEANPFQDMFEEELLVIDRRAARSLEDFRGRPRVTCRESHELAKSLAGLRPAVALPTSADSLPDSTTCIVTEGAASSAFEFSTLQPLPETEYQIEPGDAPGTVATSNPEQIELDFDEEIECVPFPWQRRPAGDDRDIVIVQDNAAPAVHPAAAVASADGNPQPPYRELFAQLRKVSS